jgi:uncharacterized glyoxalase superfamily protein PhnB
MKSQHKPIGYTTVSPYLIVDKADATINFLTQVFGATELRRIADGSGKVMHAEVRIDDTVIMLTDPGPARLASYSIPCAHLRFGCGRDI